MHFVAGVVLARGNREGYSKRLKQAKRVGLRNSFFVCLAPGAVPLLSPDQLSIVMARSGPTQTLYRKPFPLRGRPAGLKVYRRVRWQALRFAVGGSLIVGEPPTERVQPEI